MAVDTLATATDLEDFPGAPFDEDLVQIAQASVRSEAGWHIAPQRTETLYLVGRGSAYLALPTRRVVEVTAVRHGSALTEHTSGWKILGNSLYLPGGWTAGPVEVDITHGYDETPLDLYPVIASRAVGGTSRGVSQVRSGEHSVTYATADDQADSVLDRYRTLGPS